MKRKTWNKSTVKEIICGYCDYCGKELLNTMGGWIVTANKLHFCHDTKNGACFDKYLRKEKHNEHNKQHTTDNSQSPA
jgi:hypothetical protein